MIVKFLNNIRQNISKNLLKPKVLVALSGGLDSVVLLHLAKLAQWQIIACHCNFGLRGEESDGDEDFVKDLCANLEIELEVIQFDTLSIAQETNQNNIQALARDLRYDWFKLLLKKHQFDYIATAHHASDQAETILYNLAKGTGLKGLGGIKFVNKQIIRPLLFATRAEILEYAHANNLTWREDSSNKKDKYKRNYIRQHISPLMQNINIGFEKHILQTSLIVQQAQSLVQEKIHWFEENFVFIHPNYLKIDLNELSEKPYFELVIFEYLNQFGKINAEQIADFTTASIGSKWQIGDYTLCKDRDLLFVLELDAEKEDFNIEIELKEGLFDVADKELKIEILPIELFKPERNPKVAWLSKELINQKVIITNNYQSKSIKPLGMNGKQKLVSDILIDAKTPDYLKKQTLILEFNSTLLWVIGYKQSDLFKVKPEDEVVVRVEVLG